MKRRLLVADVRVVVLEDAPSEDVVFRFKEVAEKVRRLWAINDALYCSFKEGATLPNKRIGSPLSGVRASEEMKADAW